MVVGARLRLRWLPADLWDPRTAGALEQGRGLACTSYAPGRDERPTAVKPRPAWRGTLMSEMSGGSNGTKVATSPRQGTAGRELAVSLDELREAAAGGATWQTLARLCGVTARTMRRWREAVGMSDAADPGDERKPMFNQLNSDLDGGEAGLSAADPPAERVRAAIEAIEAGRADGVVKAQAALRAMADDGDLRAVLAWLRRLER